MKCVNCGSENPEGAKFCIRCGTSLAESVVTPPAAPEAPKGAMAPPAPAQQPPQPPQALPHVSEAAYAPPGATGPAAPAGGQTPAFGMPPLAYTPPPPSAGMPPGGGMPYGPAPGAPMAPGYAIPAKKHTKMYTGSLLAMLGGIVIVVAGWLPWAGSFGINVTGWDMFNTANNLGQRFVQVVESKPAFTALPMVIAGGLIVLLALLMMLFRRKAVGVITLVLSLGALAMAVLTMITFKTYQVGGISASLSLQYGIFLLALLSLVGLLGSAIALTD